MTDRNYQKKVGEVALILSEVACVDAIQTQVEFANNYVMKSHKIRLQVEDN